MKIELPMNDFIYSITSFIAARDMSSSEIEFPFETTLPIFITPSGLVLLCFLSYPNNKVIFTKKAVFSGGDTEILYIPLKLLICLL